MDKFRLNMLKVGMGLGLFLALCGTIILLDEPARLARSLAGRCPEPREANWVWGHEP